MSFKEQIEFLFFRVKFFNSCRSDTRRFVRVEIIKNLNEVICYITKALLIVHKNNP